MEHPTTETIVPPSIDLNAAEPGVSGRSRPSLFCNHEASKLTDCWVLRT
jgi:hypothetical protein